MNELFEKFAKGEIPNVIELMAAISELSNLWPVDVCPDCRSSQDNTVPKTKCPITDFV